MLGGKGRKIMLKGLVERFETNNFNKVFHFKMERYCWSVMLKRFERRDKVEGYN